MAGRPCRAPPPGSSSSGSFLSSFSYHALLVVESVISRMPPAPMNVTSFAWSGSVADPRFRGFALDVSLDGKAALVTGAGPNIGSGIALALARYGAKVACNDLDPEVSKAAVRRISRNGGEGLALSGDVSVEADVLANIAAALDALGRIDIVGT